MKNHAVTLVRNAKPKTKKKDLPARKDVKGGGIFQKVIGTSVYYKE